MSDSILSLLFTLIALTVVLVIAWLGTRFLADLVAKRSPGDPMRLRSSMALGGRSRLVVVSYRDTEYVLGVTGTRISLIDSIRSTTPISATATGITDGDDHKGAHAEEPVVRKLRDTPGS